MHPNAQILNRLFSALDRGDAKTMGACYAEDASFEDIAFTLDGRREIQAMWEMVAAVKPLATYKVLRADDSSGEADLLDSYTYRDTGRRVENPIRSSFRFRDGLIVRHEDSCDALRWGIQALGPVKGTLSWLLPFQRRKIAMHKLHQYLASHPHAGESA
jgi:ketosteroid isomerase-like protein